MLRGMRNGNVVNGGMVFIIDKLAVHIFKKSISIAAS